MSIVDGAGPRSLPRFPAQARAGASWPRVRVRVLARVLTWLESAGMGRGMGQGMGQGMGEGGGHSIN